MFHHDVVITMHHCIRSADVVGTLLFTTTMSSRQNRGGDFYFEFLPAKIEESISILNFFLPNRKWEREI